MIDPPIPPSTEPTAGSRRVIALMGWLDRYPWLLPLISFIAGWAGYWLVERGPQLARVIALMALLTWPWMLLENLFGRWLHRWSRGRLSPTLTAFVTQSVQQEMLFFALPFVLGAMRLHPAHLLFGFVLGLAALFSTLDPIYHRWVGRSGGLSVAFQAYCTFITALVVLPVALHWPVEKAVTMSVLIATASLLAGLPRLWQSEHRARALGLGLIVAVVLMLCLPLRASIPPVGLRLTESRIGQSIDGLSPGPEVKSLSVVALAQTGVVAYIAVHAPAGLNQQLRFDWHHRGQRVESIPAQIEGAEGRGWRTYTRKQHFPADPRGGWRVDVRTPSDQLIGRLYFRVTD